MFEYKKYINIIFILFISFFIFRIVQNLDIIKTLKSLVLILNPFIFAFFIAYILNPIMCYLEKELKMKRIYALLAIYVLATGVIILFITIVSPRIVKSIGQIIIDIPNHINNTQNWIDINIIKSKYLEKNGFIDYIKPNINYIISEINNVLNSIFNNIVIKTINITSIVAKIILGLIISIYLLKDKENFIKGIKKIIYVTLEDEKAKHIIDFGKEVDKIFSQFIIGKFLDSFIVGIICFIGFIMLKIPYALLMGIIIGCANMIPYFGPIIGMIPAVTITFIYMPIKALYVLIFILLIQQFDAWILEPKILGDKIGLGPVWIILAIILGGEFFGIIGMFLGVPMIAIIKVILERYINKKLILKK